MRQPVFEDKVLVITGASSGIGHALAEALALQRPRLVLAARDAARLESVAESCRRRGAQALVLPTDVTDSEQCRRLVARTVDAFGRIDALVNNAGVGMRALFEEITDLSLFERLMRVNYLGSVYPTYHALPHLKTSRGRLVVNASLSGLLGAPKLTAYAASKHAVIGFFDSLRVELTGTGVSVTVVAPDFVISEIRERALGPDGQPLQDPPPWGRHTMTAAACAALIVKSMEKRRRLVVTSFRGRIGRWIRLVAPGVVDRIALRAMGTPKTR